MFTDKILKKTPPHGLTLGEQCVSLEICLSFSNNLEKLNFCPIVTLLMRNPGYGLSVTVGWRATCVTGENLQT